MTARPHTPDESRARNNGARVPPHNLEAEESLIGAMLLSRDAIVAATDRSLSSSYFYKPAHAHIYDAILELNTADQPADITTVAARLDRHGLLDHIGGRRTLLELQANTPASANAGHYAQIVISLGRERSLLYLAGELAEALYTNEPVATIVDQIAQLQDLDELEQTTSWQFVDLMPIVTGQTAPIVPELLTRIDGQPLLYAGRIHALNSEPEAGKSMLAVEACRQELEAGHHVAYLDFEDSAESVTGRLLAMGANPDQIVDQFHYARIDDPIDHHARQLITTITDHQPLSLAIIDGVAEALAISGWKENDNHDIALFYTALPRHISRTGTTVLIIDHVVKNKDEQGRYGRGGGHKLAGIDGATYKLEAVQPFGRGLDGMSKLIIAKDRPGWLRHIGKTAAEMHVHSDENGDHLTLELRPSTTPTKGSDEPFRPTHLMEAVSRFLEAQTDELTGNQIKVSIPAKRHRFVLEALRVLVDEGYVERRPGPNRSHLHSSLKPYRNDEPHPSEPPHDPDEEPPDNDQHDLWEDDGDEPF